METTIKTHQIRVTANTNVAQVKPTSIFWQNIEFNRFGIIPIQLVIIACIGGFAAAFGAKDDTVKLALIAFPTILSLAFTLAVSPMRLIIWSSVIALLIDIAILIF